MATFYSSWYSYGAGGRYRLELYIEDPGATGTATSVSLTTRLYLETENSLSDSSNTNSLSGDLGSASGSASVSHGSSGGRTLLVSRTGSVATVIGSTVRVDVTGSISGYEALASRSLSGYVTVPARIGVPGPSPAPTVSAITASTARVAWTSTTAQANGSPITSWRLQVSESPAFTGNVFDAGASTPQTVTGLDPMTTYYARVRGTNAAGPGAYSPATSFTTAPAAPAAPTSVTVSRVSDTSQTVSWQRAATSTAPYTAQQVQRWDNVTGAWAVVGTISGSWSTTGSQSWTDTSTRADRRYQYRLRAQNASGWSAVSSASAAIYTTPAAPTGVSAAKSGANIVARWTNAATTATGATIERRADGGAWGNAVNVGAGVTSWTHTSPSPLSTWQYRVRATVSTPSLASAFVQSGVVQLAAPPNAPSGLGPSSIRDADLDVAWSWTHNPVDTSAQAAFEVHHRAAGGSSWTTTGKVGSGVSSWTLPGGTYANGTTVEWQVRTWGEHADPSPWSATASSPTSAPPTALVDTPADGGTVTTSTLTVEWTYADPEGSTQAAWALDLLDADGATVESRSGSGATASRTLSTVLTDGSSWTVRVRVRDAAGMWSTWDESGFDVQYALPPVPAVSAEWDVTTGTATVQVQVPEPEGDEIAAVTVDVWRSVDDGPWGQIASGAPLYSAVTDWTAPLTGSVRYRADAVSALPSVTSADPVEVAPVAGATVFVSGGPGSSVQCRAVSNVALTESAGVAETTLHRFAGRTRPVAFSGEQTTRTWSLATDHVPAADAGDSSARDWLDLARLPGPHLLRTPDGVRAWVSLSEVSAARGIGGTVTAVSMTLTEVDTP